MSIETGASLYVIVWANFSFLFYTACLREKNISIVFLCLVTLAIHSINVLDAIRIVNHGFLHCLLEEMLLCGGGPPKKCRASACSRKRALCVNLFYKANAKGGIRYLT